MKCQRCGEEKPLTHIVHSFADDAQPVIEGIAVCYGCGIEAEVLAEASGRESPMIVIPIKRMSKIAQLGITCGICHETFGTKSSYKAHWEDHIEPALTL